LTPDFPDTNPKCTSTADAVLHHASKLPLATIAFVSLQNTIPSNIIIIIIASLSNTDNMITNTITAGPTETSNIVYTIEEHSSDPAATIVRIQTGDTSTPYDEAIKIDPDNIQLLTNAGIYLADKKEMYLQTIFLFDKVLKKRPKLCSGHIQ
jgi:hypothetical protein